MAFRVDEAVQAGYENAMTYLVQRTEFDVAQRRAGKEALEDIIDKWGPVIDSYPSWHPLVCNQNKNYPVTRPGEDCGYKGLDHNLYLANGFITCPYGGTQEVIDSVVALPPHPVAYISAEALDVQLYHPQATPVLVTCEWNNALPLGGMIPLASAMPLILESEVPHWRNSQVAETWETMRPYFLGQPHGSRSSLFVNQETGQAIKKVWNALIYTGMFGPIKV